MQDMYSYEVIGGLHSITARKQLVSENEAFSTVKATIYAGLSDDEALHLAKRHNLNSHLTHEVTHKDYVSECYIKILIELVEVSPPVIDPGLSNSIVSSSIRFYRWIQNSCSNYPMEE